MEADVIIGLLTWPLWAFALAYGLAFRPWRWRHLGGAFFPSLDLLMCGALASGVMALYHPMPLERAATGLVDWTGLPEQMRSIDLQIHELETLPERTWLSVKEELGLSGDEPVVVPPPPEPGPVSASILPAVEGLVEVVLRFGAYGASLAVMGVALVMRLWFMGSRRRSEARARNRESLEARIRDLEEAVGRLSGTASSAVPI
jgi:hypothetical protein